MKALDFFDLNDRSQISNIIFLIGDDEVLKVLVYQKLLILLSDLDLELESFEVSNIKEISDRLTEGSLFGNRLVVFNLNNTSNVDLDIFNQSILQAKESQDFFIIKVTQADVKQIQHLITEVDCKKVNTNKFKEKLISLRLSHYNLKITEEGLKKLVERSEGTSQIESTIKALAFAIGEENTINVYDIAKSTAEPPSRKDILRALITGNVLRLSKELFEGDPLYTLTIFHNSLFKLYTWLEMTENGSKEEEEKAISLLNISKRSLKEWKASSKKFASRIIREVLESTTEAYQDVISGRDSWREKIQFFLRKLD